ncbi:MAG: hypothetical protein DLM61_02290 [Pseudonocardiales bacterium]|nr:MAG: hypothetical protein DLM61_02290 [Pseudonocardiales bacterium]
MARLLSEEHGNPQVMTSSPASVVMPSFPVSGEMNWPWLPAPMRMVLVGVVGSPSSTSATL